VKRAKDILPKQGQAHPWRVLNKYEVDKKTLLVDPIEDGILMFQTQHSATEKPLADKVG
jgi:hypothetical protein